MDYRTYPNGQTPRQVVLPPVAPLTVGEQNKRRGLNTLDVSLVIAAIVIAVAALIFLINDPFTNSMEQSQAARNEELRQKVLAGQLSDTPMDVGLTQNGTPVVNVGEFGQPTVYAPVTVPPPPPPPAIEADTSELDALFARFEAEHGDDQGR